MTTTQGAPKTKRQFCRKCLRSCVPTVTLSSGPGRKLHWCAEHAADADNYRVSV